MQRNRHLLIALLAVGLLWLASGASAASGDFNVSSFIPKHFKDARLYTSAGVSMYGNGSKNESDTSNGGNYADNVSEYKSSNYNVDLQFNHRLRYITIPLWYDIGTQIEPRWSRYTSSSDQSRGSTPTSVQTYDYHSESHSGSYNLNLDEYIDAGQYLDGDWFLAGTASLYYSYSKSISSDGSSTQTSRNWSAGVPGSRTVTEYVYRSDYNQPGDSRSFSVDAMIAPGFGRIYDGVYAFLAISMVEQLQAKGRLKRMPTHDEMMQLTEIIYQRFEGHSIDWRLYEIESLQMIMNYLNSIGAVDVSGPEGYTLVQDVWEYYPWGSHEFGWKFRAGVGIDYTRGMYQSHEESDQYQIQRNWNEATPGTVNEVLNDTSLYGYGYISRNVRSMPYFSGLLEYRHPVSNNWQIDIDAQFWLYFSEKDSSFYIDRYFDRDGDTLLYYYENSTTWDRSSHYRLELDGSVRYYFDNRTSFTGSMMIAHETWDQTRIYADTNTSGGGSSSIDSVTYSPGGIQLYLSGNLEYRLSVPTTWNLGVYYNRNNWSSYTTFPGERRDWNWQLYTSIEHYFF